MMADICVSQLNQNIMNSKVAIIGLGNIGRAVAANLVKGGREVIVADRTLEKATALANKLGANARPMEVPSAIQEAGILILAIYFEPIRAFLAAHAGTLQGKIIVDPSNPIAPAEGGGFKKIIDENVSAGMVLSAEIPVSATLVKAFGTLGAATLSDAAHALPRSVLFYALDNLKVKPVIEELLRDSGFEPVNIGGLDKSIRIEVFGDLHEYGALGRAVNLLEVQGLESIPA
jgi:predicted dinucleotide-binding enzyme